MAHYTIRTICCARVPLLVIVALLVGVVGAVLATLPSPAAASAVGAAEITWTGAAGDRAWSNPENWAGGRVPGPADVARLVGLTPDARVDAAFAGVVGGLYLGPDYAGTLYLERALWVQGDLEVAGGTLYGDNAGLDVAGAVHVSGGTLVTPAGATMNAVTLGIAAPGEVRLGAHGKLNLSGSGRPLTGDGLLDTVTYRPNSVEYTGTATTDLADAVPFSGLRAASPAGFARVGGLVLDESEFLASAVIDPDGAYAYFGDWEQVGHIYKVDLATFTHVGTLTLPAGEERPVAAVMDPAGAYAYFGTIGTNPASRVVKVDLSTFTRVDSLALEDNNRHIRCAVIDPDGAYAYFGTLYRGVVKIDLSTFTRTDTLALGGDEYNLYTALIDPAGDYAYFGTLTEPGIVVKVDLATFTRAAALTLGTGESGLRSAVMDPSGAYAYFGTSTEPGIVVQVDLAAFTRAGALTLDSGENYLQAAVIDPAGDYAYFSAGIQPGPGHIVQVGLAALTRTSALTLDSAEYDLIGAAVDPAGQYAYFAAFNVPGRVVKIELGAAVSDRWIYLPMVLKNSP